MKKLNRENNMINFSIRQGKFILHGLQFYVAHSTAEVNVDLSVIKAHLHLCSKYNLQRLYRVLDGPQPIYAQLETENSHHYFILEKNRITIIESVEAASLVVVGGRVVTYPKKNNGRLN